MQPLRFVRCLTILVTLGGPAIAKADTFTALYAFGDSLSDAGNVFLATGGATPAAPYAGGHFSNGPTWVENLSQQLGLGPLAPSLAGGTDYAFGGAVTGTAVPGAGSTVPNISQQVGLFSAATGGHAPSGALYTVWIGSNDVIQAFQDVAGAALTLAAAGADLALAAQTVAAAVQTLAVEGAKTFIVPLVPDIGKVPLANGNAITATLATALTIAYNAQLVSDILAFASADGITVDFMDAFSLTDAAVATPTAFGLTDATHPCYTGTFAGGGTACATPNSFLFWDLIHPTETGHQALASLARADLPAPNLFGAFLAGALFLILKAPKARTAVRRGASATTNGG
jgi:outer membrane lipase/esterase